MEVKVASDPRERPIEVVLDSLNVQLLWWTMDLVRPWMYKCSGEQWILWDQYKLYSNVQVPWWTQNLVRPIQVVLECLGASWTIRPKTSLGHGLAICIWWPFAIANKPRAKRNQLPRRECQSSEPLLLLLLLLLFWTWETNTSRSRMYGCYGVQWSLWGYLGHREVCSKGLLSDPEGEFK